MENHLNRIQEIILESAEDARRETGNEPEPELVKSAKWPINCTVGPGLEGAIACESKVGYVNGSKGWLIYRGYDIFDLCAYSNYEEVSYLLLHGRMPDASELKVYRRILFNCGHLNKALRLLMGFPIEEMNPMGALRLGTNLMRQEFTNRDKEEGKPKIDDAIASDEDSIAMETFPAGSEHAAFEFRHQKISTPSASELSDLKKQKKHIVYDADSIDACYHLIAGVSTIVAAISRIRKKRLPLEPDPELNFAGNLLYMITGKKPSPVEERMMDICLILHADHGMNASTFAAMVVASTLSDMFLSVGSGIAALNGALHGGANETVVKNLREIGTVENTASWVEKKLAEKKRISGFGHRVYKVYDPRARVLGPLAGLLVQNNPRIQPLYHIACELERTVVSGFGREKMIFPNVDFYSGLVYSCLGIDSEFFTPMFAASRVAGWTARILEYIETNRLFRPRSSYIGEFNKTYIPIHQR